MAATALEKKRVDEPLQQLAFHRARVREIVGMHHQLLQDAESREQRMRHSNAINVLVEEVSDAGKAMKENDMKQIQISLETLKSVSEPREMTSE